MCDEVLWLRQGKLADRGDPKRVVDAYLTYVAGGEEALLAREHGQPRGGGAAGGPGARGPPRSPGTGRDAGAAARSRSPPCGCSTTAARSGTSTCPARALTVALDVRAAEPVEDFVFGVGLFTADGVSRLRHEHRPRGVRAAGCSRARPRSASRSTTCAWSRAPTCSTWPPTAATARPTTTTAASTRSGSRAGSRTWACTGPRTAGSFAAAASRWTPPAPRAELDLHDVAERGRAVEDAEALAAPPLGILGTMTSDLPELLARAPAVAAQGRAWSSPTAASTCCTPATWRCWRRPGRRATCWWWPSTPTPRCAGSRARAGPLVPEGERAEALRALEAVDRVVVYDEPTPREVIAALLPDVLVKGADWAQDAIVGREEVEAAGGRVVRVTLVPGRSTTPLRRADPKIVTRALDPPLPGGRLRAALRGAARGPAAGRRRAPLRPRGHRAPARAPAPDRAPAAGGGAAGAEVEAAAEDLRTLAARGRTRRRRAGLPRARPAAFRGPAPPPRGLAAPRRRAARRRPRPPRGAWWPRPPGLLRPTLRARALRDARGHAARGRETDARDPARGAGRGRLPARGPGGRARARWRAAAAILDVFPPDRDAPVRLEFFGDTLESLRRFDPETPAHDRATSTRWRCWPLVRRLRATRSACRRALRDRACRRALRRPRASWPAAARAPRAAGLCPDELVRAAARWCRTPRCRVWEHLARPACRWCWTPRRCGRRRRPARAAREEERDAAARTRWRSSREEALLIAPPRCASGWPGAPAAAPARGGHRRGGPHAAEPARAPLRGRPAAAGGGPARRAAAARCSSSATPGRADRLRELLREDGLAVGEGAAVEVRVGALSRRLRAARRRPCACWPTATSSRKRSTSTRGTRPRRCAASSPTSAT